VLVFSEDIENIRNGLTLMTTIAPESLCRYLRLNGESVVLRNADKFSAPLSAERVLVESVKSHSIWQELYESGAFELMEFCSLGDVAIENLSESEKAFCVRMSKEMVRVPAGEFMRGALEDDQDAYDDERPRHKVTLTRDFLMGKYAVTQALWDSVMGSNPSTFTGANRPVECVSWFDVVAFCNKVSELEGLEPVYDGLGDYQVGDDQNMGEDEIEALLAAIKCNWNAKGYRLPTEAEWEYSARGGHYHKYAGSNNVDEVAWYRINIGDETHPVGQRKPNDFGLYDMSGNVWEWVWDRMELDDDLNIIGDSLYLHAPVTDPYGSTVGFDRVFRGGSCRYYPRSVRTSNRGGNSPVYQSIGLGFRICRFP